MHTTYDVEHNGWSVVAMNVSTSTIPTSPNLQRYVTAETSKELTAGDSLNLNTAAGSPLSLVGMFDCLSRHLCTIAKRNIGLHVDLMSL